MYTTNFKISFTGDYGKVMEFESLIDRHSILLSWTPQRITDSRYTLHCDGIAKAEDTSKANIDALTRFNDLDIEVDSIIKHENVEYYARFNKGRMTEYNKKPYMIIEIEGEWDDYSFTEKTENNRFYDEIIYPVLSAKNRAGQLDFVSKENFLDYYDLSTDCFIFRHKRTFDLIKNDKVRFFLDGYEKTIHAEERHGKLISVFESIMKPDELKIQGYPTPSSINIIFEVTENHEGPRPLYDMNWHIEYEGKRYRGGTGNPHYSYLLMDDEIMNIIDDFHYTEVVLKEEPMLQNNSELNRSELDCLCACSLRYALGRQTYIVSEVAEIIAANLSNISLNILNIMKRDIEEALQQGQSGDPAIDKPVWVDLLGKIKTAIKERS